MKSLSIILMSSLILVTLCKSEDFVSDLVEYCLEDYQEHVGVLIFSKDKKTILLDKEGSSSPIKLEFAYDAAEDMVIDDMGVVTVSGYYSKVHRVLFVEEIEGSACVML